MFYLRLIVLVSLLLGGVTELVAKEVALKKLRVGVLHPLLGDLARQVGGERVQVVDIVKPEDDLHFFRPRAKEIRLLESCHFILASGKGFEAYLTGLRDALGEKRIIEVGRGLPSQRLDQEAQLYACCPHHGASLVDPHWWHDVSLMRRAADLVKKELVRYDPQHRSYYEQQGKEVQKRLKNLEQWVKAQVSLIPRKQRRLVTAHGAFGYFCKAYGFKASFIQGLNKEGEISSRQLLTVIEQIKQEQVQAVFAEKNSNPKVLAQIAKQAGVRVGPPLNADGGAYSYEAMIRSNVSAIVNALAPAQLSR